MGSNGIVTEKAQHNIDKEKFDENFSKIFKEREKIACLNCDLSSRQYPNENFTCPHCNFDNILKKEHSMPKCDVLPFIETNRRWKNIAFVSRQAHEICKLMTYAFGYDYRECLKKLQREFPTSIQDKIRNSSKEEIEELQYIDVMADTVKEIYKRYQAREVFLKRDNSPLYTPSEFIQSLLDHKAEI